MSIEFISFYILANYLEKNILTDSNFILVCFLIQVVAWGVQFIGHGVFERKRPALLDNLLQVFIAPIFVMLEYLFLLGFCKDLQQEIKKKILARVGSTSTDKTK